MDTTTRHAALRKPKPSLPEPAAANPKGCRGSVRHFIFDLFLNQMTEQAKQASQFMEEITPCMININRRIAKDLTLWGFGFRV